MSKPLSEKAFAITGRCSRNKNLFGISVDEVSRGQFSFVWSFRLDEAKANKASKASQLRAASALNPTSPDAHIAVQRHSYFVADAAWSHATMGRALRHAQDADTPQGWKLLNHST